MIHLYALAALAALAITFQAPINAGLGRALMNQPLLAALISFSMGTIGLLIICLWRADFTGFFQTLSEQPLWRFSGGFMGAFMVFCSAFIPLRIGMSNFLFVAIITQLIAALVIDHFGLLGMPTRPADVWRLMGVAVMVVGLAIFFFGERAFKG